MIPTRTTTSGPCPQCHWRDQDGFTLIEMLVAMAIGLIVSLAAVALLILTTNDVGRITERTQATQTARIGLEKIMSELHSACVAVTVNPIQAGSTATAIRFISENSPLNSLKEPVSSLTTVRLHEIVYEPASGKTEGMLVEKSWQSYGTTPEYKFNTSETPTKTILLTGVTESVNEATKATIPIFQYFRYYVSGDSEVKLGHANVGQLDPTPVKTLTEKAEAEQISEVTVNFSALPHDKEGTGYDRGRPVAVEDSAVFRLAPSSEDHENEPCTQTV
jgi:prepilin-type N-terminal cleavage/methylation domain-containing protein